MEVMGLPEGKPTAFAVAVEEEVVEEAEDLKEEEEMVVGA